MLQYISRRTVLGSVGATALFPSLASAVAGRANAPVLQVDLRLDPPQSCADGWRCALVRGGLVTGGIMQGCVRSGRLEWLVDPASGAVELRASAQVLRADGMPVELRDRTARAAADAWRELPGLATSPALFDAAGHRLPQSIALVGRLDPRSLPLGMVRLQAFEPRAASRIFKSGDKVAVTGAQARNFSTIGYARSIRDAGGKPMSTGVTEIYEPESVTPKRQ